MVDSALYLFEVRLRGCRDVTRTSQRGHWRPLGRQIYFGLLSPAIPSRPSARSCPAHRRSSVRWPRCASSGTLRNRRPIGQDRCGILSDGILAKHRIPAPTCDVDCDVTPVKMAIDGRLRRSPVVRRSTATHCVAGSWSLSGNGGRGSARCRSRVYHRASGGEPASVRGGPSLTGARRRPNFFSLEAHLTRGPLAQVAVSSDPSKNVSAAADVFRRTLP